MIFQYTLDLLLSGRKTQTCRIANAGEIAERNAHDEIIAVTFKGRDKYRIGKTYAVQPARGKPAVARIGLVGLDHKHMNEISTEEAQAEGYATRDEFLAVWKTIHGEANANAEVWVLTFELVHTI